MKLRGMVLSVFVASAVATAWFPLAGASAAGPAVGPRVPKGGTAVHPRGTNFALNDVACVSTSFCMAVGTQAPIWNGTTWTNEQVPSPPGTTERFLLGVSCSAVTFCMVVGQYVTAQGAFPLAEKWNGTTWTVLSPATAPASTGGGFNAVACHSGINCVAVGYYTTASAPGVTLAESWNGKAWTVKPAIAAGGQSQLTSVSCPALKFCMASGYYNTATTSRSLAESWNGKTWSLQLPPNPSASSLKSISCASITFCVAVGSHGSSPPAPFAAFFNGSTWTASLPPLPKGATLGILDGISCRSSTDCTVVGVLDNPATETLAYGWNGTRWTLQSAVTPPTSSQDALLAVACPTVGVCDAVGGFDSSTGSRLPLAEQSTGGIWKVTVT
jgi:hypothetical protein